MQENAEYCTGQDFEVVFITTQNRLWQCKQCAFEVLQPLNETGTPIFPERHPKPVPVYFTMNNEQRAKIKALLEED